MKRIKLKKGYHYVTGCNKCPMKKSVIVEEGVQQICKLNDKIIGWRNNSYPDWCPLENK